MFVLRYSSHPRCCAGAAYVSRLRQLCDCLLDAPPARQLAVYRSFSMPGVDRLQLLRAVLQAVAQQDASLQTLADDYFRVGERGLFFLPVFGLIVESPLPFLHTNNSNWNRRRKRSLRRTGDGRTRVLNHGKYSTYEEKATAALVQQEQFPRECQRAGATPKHSILPHSPPPSC